VGGEAAWYLSLDLVGMDVAASAAWMSMDVQLAKQNAIKTA